MKRKDDPAAESEVIKTETGTSEPDIHDPGQEAKNVLPNDTDPGQGKETPNMISTTKTNTAATVIDPKRTRKMTTRTRKKSTARRKNRR